MATTESRSILPEAEQYELARKLYDRGLFGIFEDPDQTITLKNGRLSPHYLDMRKGVSNYDTRQHVAGTLVQMANLRSPGLRIYNHFVGTPEAMTSYVASAADIGCISLLQPRVAMTKTAGNKTPILGEYERNDSAAAFDDVVTEGETKVDLVEGLAEHGIIVRDYFVVLDREEGGAPYVESVTGVKVIAALGLSSTVRMLRQDEVASLAQYDNVARYIEQYGEPHAKEAMATAL